MKAYLIDPTNKTVTEVDVDKADVLQSIYQHTRCDCVDAVRLNAQGDCVYVDDNGLLNDAGRRHGLFRLIGRNANVILAGYGLVLGVNLATGESRAPHMSLEDVTAMVDSPTLVEALKSEPEER